MLYFGGADIFPPTMPSNRSNRTTVLMKAFKPAASSNKLRAISLFSNCGAGDFGFAQAGFDFHVMAELELGRLRVACENHPHAAAIIGDIRETWPLAVAAYQASAGPYSPDLLAACPPCQGMSTAQSRRGKSEDADAGSRDPRNLLVLPIAEIARTLRPKAIVVENVQAFLTRKVRHPEKGTAISAARLLTEALDEQYSVYPIVVDLADYGVPQTRRRAFLTFLRRDLPVIAQLEEKGCTPYPIPTHAVEYGGRPISIREALAAAALPRLSARSPSTSRSKDPMHFVPSWDERQYAMVAAIPRWSGKSAWDNLTCHKCGHEAKNAHVARCSKCRSRLLRPTVEDGSGIRLVRGFVNSSYRRMKPNEPAATVTTASGRIGSDFTIHPSQNRVLSPKECCVLQTIPDDFSWADTIKRHGHTYLRAMIGEAVPPAFTAMHGAVLKKMLSGAVEERDLLRTSDRRNVEARSRLFSTPGSDQDSRYAKQQKRDRITGLSSEGR